MWIRRLLAPIAALLMTAGCSAGDATESQTVVGYSIDATGKVLTAYVLVSQTTTLRSVGVSSETSDAVALEVLVSHDEGNAVAMDGYLFSTTTLKESLGARKVTNMGHVVPLVDLKQVAPRPGETARTTWTPG